MKHPECCCPGCNVLSFYPALPSLTPKQDVSDNWTVDCHWVSQLVNGRAVVIHRGMATDGASVPRSCWRIIGHPFSKDILPHALAHDGLYAAELMTRAECDKWFLDSMTLAGIGYIKRTAIYAAVRMFGGWVWSRHNTKGVEAARNDVQLLNVTEYQHMAELRDIRFL